MAIATNELRKFITDNFLFGNATGEFAFTDDDSFHERGIIDSMGMMELVAFIQSNYAIALRDDDLVPENLDSISRITAFVERKRHGRFAHAG